MVLTDKDGYKSVDYSGLTPVLVETIKDLGIRIKELNAKNERAELEIAKLKASVEKLMQSTNAAEAKK